MVTSLSDEDISILKNKLLTERDKRIFPHIDEKILADWNAMYIKSLLQVSSQLNDLSLQEKALSSLEELEEKLIDHNNFTLFHSMINDQVGYKGFLDDYAYLLKVYLEAYKVTYDIKYFDKAVQLADAGIRKFWSEENEGFVFSDITTVTITN